MKCFKNADFDVLTFQVPLPKCKRRRTEVVFLVVVACKEKFTFED